MHSENSIDMAITIIIIPVNLQSSSNSSSVSFVKSSRPCCHPSSTPGQPPTFPLVSAPRGDLQRPYQQGSWALWLPVGSGHCRGSTGDWREEEKREQVFILRKTTPRQPCSGCLPQLRSLLLLKEYSSVQLSLFPGLHPSLGWKQLHCSSPWVSA